MVGINADKYADRSPYLPVAYPAAPDAESGERLTSARLEERTGINLIVRPPRQPVEVRVLVTWEDGRPAEKVTLMVEDSRSVQRYHKADATDAQGLGILQLYQAARYTLQAAEFTYDESAFLQYAGEVGPIPFDRSTATVQIVLRLKQRTPRRR